MAGFRFETCRLVLDECLGAQISSAELARLPSTAAATIATTHEYIHFLQLLSSLGGLRLLQSYLSLGIECAARLGNVGATFRGQRVDFPTPVDLLPTLALIPSGAARRDAVIGPKSAKMRERLGTLLLPCEFPANAHGAEWTLGRQRIPGHEELDEFAGFLTDSGEFRPFTFGMIAENMARRIDQWVSTNEGMASIPPVGREERYHYNSLNHILARPEYARNVAEVVRERLCVVLARLALSCERCDRAIELMLGSLRSVDVLGGTVAAISDQLQLRLVDNRLLDYNAYNRFVANITENLGRSLTRDSYYPFYKHLERIHSAVTAAGARPAEWANSEMGWAHVRAMMTAYTIPPVQTSDGMPTSVDGVAITDTISTILVEISRVLFG